MTRLHSRTHFALLTCVLLFIMGASSHSQKLRLSDKKATTSKVEFVAHFQCSDSSASLGLDKRNIRLYEDGVELKDFSLIVTQPRIGSSAALIMDRCGIMCFHVNEALTHLDLLKRYGKIFTAAMDTSIDEAELIPFNVTPRVEVFLTRDRRQLTAGIDAITCDGKSAEWDAVVAGVTELANNATKEKRFALLFADGWGDASSNTVQDVIAASLVNNIPLYAISVGENPKDSLLAAVARATGGDIISERDSAKLSAIFRYLMDYGRLDAPTTLVSYVPRCLDFAVHTVTMEVSGMPGCSGAVSQSLTYLAKLDTSTVARVLSPKQTYTLHEGETIVLRAQTMRAVWYQWYKDGTAITGATADTLRLGPLSKKDSGSYSFICGSACLDRSVSPDFILGVLTDVRGITTAPVTAQLLPNYPNPFSTSTLISFHLGRRADAELTVHDLLGRTVATLARGEYEAGDHRLTFEAQQLPSGLYYLELRVNGTRKTAPLLLMR